MSIEKQIVTKLIEDALALGYNVSVWDGEEWTLGCSRDARLIEAALATTDSDVLRFRDSINQLVGSVLLIWGNDADVISDHSDNPLTCALVEGAYGLAEELAA